MIYPTLYKRATNNKVSQWTVEVENDKFRTISGYEDGEKVTSAWTQCQPKNSGKKNSTTPEQQAVAEAEALITKRKSLGYWNDKTKIDIEVYFEPMLAKKWEDEKNKVKYPLWSQPKLDGIRCIVKIDGMWTRNGKKIISAPHIFRDLQPLFNINPDLIFDGELYADKETADFNTIISCVRKTKPSKEDLQLSEKYIQYYIYDLPSCDEIFTTRYGVNLCDLHLPKCCVVVPTYTLKNEQEVNNKLTEYINQGYEGQMLRTNGLYENKRSKTLLKHKTFFDEEFIIIGYEEGIGNLANKIGKLKFKTQEGVEFSAAVNGTWEYLTELWKRKDELIGLDATVKYFEKTPDGSLRFPKVINIDRSWE